MTKELSIKRDKHVQAIKELTDHAKGFAVRTALKIGEHLQALHELHSGKGRDGEFRKCVEENFDFTTRTAYNYRSAFLAFGNCKEVDRFEDSALYILSSDNAPEEAKTRALTLAKRTFITKAKAQEIVKECASEIERKAGEDDQRSGKPFPTSLESEGGDQQPHEPPGTPLNDEEEDGDQEADAEPVDAPETTPEPPTGDSWEGGAEAHEAIAPLGKLLKSLAAAIRQWDEVKAILPKSQGIQDIYDGIEKANKAATTLQVALKRAKQ